MRSSDIVIVKLVHTLNNYTNMFVLHKSKVNIMPTRKMMPKYACFCYELFIKK